MPAVQLHVLTLHSTPLCALLPLTSAARHCSSALCSHVDMCYARVALAQGKSVVIDNTNPDPATRKRYVDLAKKKGMPARCVWVSTAREVAEHLNLVRAIAKTSDHPPVPDIAYNSFASKFVAPEPSEGFSEVVTWEFAVGPQVVRGLGWCL
jgi:hypothetical protein